MVECLKERNVNALKETFKLPAVIGLGDTEWPIEMSAATVICVSSMICVRVGHKTMFKEKRKFTEQPEKMQQDPPPPITFAPIAHTSGGTEIVTSAVSATMSQLFMKTLSAERQQNKYQ